MSYLFGYRGASLLLLQKVGASIGDIIDLKTTDSSIKGSLIPRYEHSDDKHIVVKLDNGYNIGVKLDSIREIKLVSKCGPPAFKQPPLPQVDDSLPVVAIIGTGGTIASRIDYRTGGVHPQFSAQDLYAVVPEIAKYAQIRAVPLFNVYSEHVNAGHWTKISEKIIEILPSGVDGVVVAHGTDTMAYTSAALSFALSGVGVPVVMVGSQRSTDRPSSDAALNLVGAVV
ncbi:MAG TPA: asparaginase domain-containing protein, partial [Nitrososphaerales archaeon]